MNPRLAGLFFTGLLAVLMLAGPAGAQERGLWLAGGRLGFDDGRNDETFDQAEVFAARLLPIAAASGPRLSLAIFLEASAGLLRGGNTQGFVGTFGPGLAFGLWDDRLLLETGTSPTLISQDTYGDEDLGGAIQFTSHVGLAARVYKGLSIGYRFQHMSNAGLYDRNPGVNLHMAEVAWRF